MARGMKILAVVAVLLTVLFAALYAFLPLGVFFSLAITAGTLAYHLLMRLMVGGIYNACLHNRVDYRKRWFVVGETEKKLYNFLKVKQWKKFLPTYDPATFDKKQHSWEEIAGATCQSELVHETIAVLSFLPIVFSVWFGSTLVFVLTSVFSALFDLSFVMLQRYNRPRIIRIIDR